MIQGFEIDSDKESDFPGVSDDVVCRVGGARVGGSQVGVGARGKVMSLRTLAKGNGPVCEDDYNN